MATQAQNDNIAFLIGGWGPAAKAVAVAASTLFPTGTLATPGDIDGCKARVSSQNTQDTTDISNTIDKKFKK